MKINPLHSLTALAAICLLGACTTVNQTALPEKEQAPPAPPKQIAQAQMAQAPVVQMPAVQAPTVIGVAAPPPQQVIVQTPASPPPPLVVRPQPIKMSATGHGSIGSYSSRQNSTQQKLMAMRAAKLDAYRNLAEQVYGFKISGSTTVNAFAAQNDTVRSHVEAFIRGAKIVDISVSDDGIYEATVELQLPPDFSDCILRGTCFPQPEALTGCAGPGCGPMSAVCVGAGCAKSSGTGSWWNSLFGGD